MKTTKCFYLSYIIVKYTQTEIMKIYLDFNFPSKKPSRIRVKTEIYHIIALQENKHLTFCWKVCETHGGDVL